MSVSTTMVLGVHMLTIFIVALITMVSQRMGMTPAYLIQNGFGVIIFGFEISMREQTLKGSFIACLFHAAHFGLIDRMERLLGHVCFFAGADRSLWSLFLNAPKVL